MGAAHMRTLQFSQPCQPTAWQATLHAWWLSASVLGAIPCLVPRTHLWCTSMHTPLFNTPQPVPIQHSKFNNPASTGSVHRGPPSWTSSSAGRRLANPPARQPAGSPTASPTPPAGAIWRRAARCARWEAGSPAAPWLTPTACMQGNVAQRPPLLSCSHQSLLGG